MSTTEDLTKELEGLRCPYCRRDGVGYSKEDDAYICAFCGAVDKKRNRLMQEQRRGRGCGQTKA